MQKLHYSIVIAAPREKVWHTMLYAATYGEWTKPFSEGSRFEGSWEEGSEIKFFGSGDPDAPSDNDEAEGMYSRIAENRENEFLSIEHLGIIKNGEIDTTSDEVKKWTPAFENYTFTDVEGGTQVDVDMDSADEYADMFNEQWPKALEALKEIAER